MAATGPPPGVPQYYPITGAPPPPTMPTVDQVPGPFPPNVYANSMAMAPPATYPTHLDAPPTSMHSAHRYRPEESQSPRNQPSGSGSGPSPVVSNIQPSTPQSRSGTTRAVSDLRAPGSSGAVAAAGGGSSSRRSPLSLTSITGPTYDSIPSSSSHQPKNFHAQTLILGERLRIGPNVLEGPAIPSTSTRTRRQPRRVRSRNPRRYTWMGHQDLYPCRLLLTQHRRRPSKSTRQGLNCGE